MTIGKDGQDQTEILARTTRRRVQSVRLSLDEQIRRFDPAVKRSVRRLAKASPRFADLIFSFPGAAHALASTATERNRRTRARAAVDDGQSLRAVADLLDLPVWLRRLPPEAFHGAVPDVPDTPSFVRRISTRLPRSGSLSANWLEAVAYAHSVAGEDFAIWVADRVSVFAAGVPIRQALRPFALYVIVSRDRSGPARDLIVTPWSPDLSTTTVVCATMSWLRRIDLVFTLSDVKLEPWLAARTVGEYNFEPLLDVESLLDEARAMQNCVDNYTGPLRTRAAQLYSLRKQGERIATVEVGQQAKDCPTLAIKQLKGPRNAHVDGAVWAVAYGWLAAQPDRLDVPHQAEIQRMAGTRKWQDYFARYTKMMPDVTDERFARLDDPHCQMMRDVVTVARNAGVRSWQFG